VTPQTSHLCNDLGFEGPEIGLEIIASFIYKQANIEADKKKCS
jgi:hypothetical protein